MRYVNDRPTRQFSLSTLNSFIDNTGTEYVTRQIYQKFATLDRDHESKDNSDWRWTHLTFHK